MLKIPHAQSGLTAYVTLSLRISSQIPTPGAQIEFLIATADRALYAAKQQGRKYTLLQFRQ
jgi:PleD family two-component response regulator